MNKNKQFYFRSTDKLPKNSTNFTRKSADKRNLVEPLRYTTNNQYYGRRVQTEFNDNSQFDNTNIQKLGRFMNSKSPINDSIKKENKTFKKVANIYGEKKQKKVAKLFVQTNKQNASTIHKNQAQKAGVFIEDLPRSAFSKKLATQADYNTTSQDKYQKRQNKYRFDNMLASKERNMKMQVTRNSKSKQTKGNKVLKSYGSKQKNHTRFHDDVSQITNFLSKSKTNICAKESPGKNTNQVLKVISNIKKELKTLKTEPCEITKPKVQFLQKIGEGTFGQVYKAKLQNRIVAVKKVFQDKKYKNRQLQILNMIKNDFVLNVIDTFYTQEKSNKNEVKDYLNVVMEYYQQNLFEAINQPLNPISNIQIKLYMYQLFRGLMYIHSLDICHRDIKPQNLLVDTTHNRLVICDFGSAKKLVKGEENISYICSRCYRAPQLIFDCVDYTTKVDVWSAGCVLLELLTGQPFFLGDSNIGQLAQIIKILGTPSKTQVVNMNSEYDLDEYKFPKVKAQAWKQIFPKMDSVLQDFVKKLMVYSPQDRLSAGSALAHEYFDELRQEHVYNELVSKRRISCLFNFSKQQLKGNEHLMNKLIPAWFLSSVF